MIKKRIMLSCLNLVPPSIPIIVFMFFLAFVRVCFFKIHTNALKNTHKHID